MNVMIDRQLNDVPRGTSLRTPQVEMIKQILSKLVEQCPARRTLVSECSGQVIASGGTQFFANPEGLAALAAGYMAAGQAIMRLTEPRLTEQFILREGLESYTFLCEAGQRLILFAQVDKDVPIGWARINVQHACERLAATMTDSEEKVVWETPDWNLADLTGEIDDALNALWKGML